jgi:hypothetical protein
MSKIKKPIIGTTTIIMKKATHPKRFSPSRAFSIKGINIYLLEE